MNSHDHYVKQARFVFIGSAILAALGLIGVMSGTNVLITASLAGILVAAGAAVLLGRR